MFIGMSIERHCVGDSWILFIRIGSFKFSKNKFTVSKTHWICKYRKLCIFIETVTKIKMLVASLVF